MVLFGFKYEPPILSSLNIPLKNMSKPHNEYYHDFMDKMNLIRNDAIIFNGKYQDKIKAKYDKKSTPHKLKDGDLGVLQIPPSKFGYSKFASKWEGP